MWDHADSDNETTSTTNQENGNFLLLPCAPFPFFSLLLPPLHSVWTSQRHPLVPLVPLAPLAPLDQRTAKGSRGCFLRLYYLFLTLDPYSAL